MAKKAEDCGEFLVIECTASELARAVHSPGICDWCGKRKPSGYYIAVLNHWYCPGCYAQWRVRAEYYHQDRVVEEKNYRMYARLLGL